MSGILNQICKVGRLALSCNRLLLSGSEKWCQSKLPTRSVHLTSHAQPLHSSRSASLGLGTSVMNQQIRTHRYDAYPKYQGIPADSQFGPRPFKPKMKVRTGYGPEYHMGGLLPRSKKYEDKPLPNSHINFLKRNQWTEKKALFGQNDYIDILGDGTLHPWQLMDGPKWLRGFNGNELQRNIRRLKYEGDFLREVYPTKFKELQSRVFFLYKKWNHKKRSRFWAGGRSRFLKIYDNKHG